MPAADNLATTKTRNLTWRDLQSAAASLRNTSSHLPSIAELATSLNLEYDLCRSIVNNERRRNPNLNWQTIGVRTGFVSAERKWLADLNSQLTTPLERHYIIKTVLHLADQRKITAEQTKVLIYAIKFGFSSFEDLDQSFVDKFGGDPHRVSGLLHTTKRGTTHQAGIFEVIDREIKLRYQAEIERDAPIKVYRAFAENFYKWRREDVEKRLFEESIAQRQLSPAVGDYLAQLFESGAAHSLRLEPFQFKLLHEIVQRVFIGATRDLATLADALDVSVSKVRNALVGLNKRPGIYEVLNGYMQQDRSATKSRLLDSMVSPNLNDAPQISRLLRDHVDEKEDTNKSYLKGIVLSLAREDLKFPHLAMRHEDVGKLTSPRPLLSHQVPLLLEAYYSGRFGSLAEIRDNLSEITGMNCRIQVHVSKLNEFFYGHNEEASVRVGAIEVLRSELEQENGLIDDSANEVALQRRLHIADTAQQISEEIDPDRIARISSVFYNRTTQSLSDIALLALSLLNADKIDDLAARSFFADVYTLTQKTISWIGDRSNIQLLNNAYAAANTISPKNCIIPVFFRAARLSAVSIESLSKMLAEQCDIIGFPYHLVWAQYAASNVDSNSISSVERRFMTRVYRRFVEMLFSELSPFDLPAEEYRDVPLLFSKLQNHREQAIKEKQVVEERIAEFYKSYSPERVIRSFRSYLIQGHLNPNGIPFNTLLEAATDALFDAAREYDPNRGSAFNSYAVSQIQWKLSNLARKDRRDRELFPVSINNTVGDDGTELEDLIGSEGKKESLNDFQSERYDDLLEKMKFLSPIQKRTIELRFGLGADVDDEAEGQRLVQIAETLFKEGYLETVVTRERVRQIEEEALSILRRATLTGTIEEWEDFFANIDEREAPAAIISELKKGRVRISDKLVFSGLEDRKSGQVIVSIERVFQNAPMDYEIFIAVRDFKMKESEALFNMNLENGRIASIERVD